ncbi:MAG: PAS domain-containing methyl-accepting chemotaxis protein [Beijerinckiaceae bacterium]
MRFGIFPIRSEAKLTLEALGRSLAIVEFAPSGHILSANENFCEAMGYEPSEIIGRHHSIFVPEGFAKSEEYEELWNKLRSGGFDEREYLRIGKGGREVWIRASYNPILNASGKLIKIVKLATDITIQKQKAIEDASRLDAIFRSQAVIEFTPEGEILSANDNFLKAVGYTIGEIRGKHHRMFVGEELAARPAYAEFWSRLRRGEFITDEFKRIGKGGREVWIQASYNPIFDTNNQVVKVIKIASDLTERVMAVQKIGAGLDRLAHGDLTQSIDDKFTIELDALRRNFNTTNNQLGETLAQLIDGFRSINSAALETAVANNDLSRRTEQQAASIEETAAAVREVTDSVSSVAQSAKKANSVAVSAQAGAENGGAIVKEAIDAMERIQKSSQSIEQITTSIDEIAFQTNLLALNAGVEAARAGDAGRGFAVVASEVRALAQHSADAAKQIKTLIESSVEQVADGVDRVTRTGAALLGIVDQVSELKKLVSEIAEVALTQAQSLRQINGAVSEMDQNTQKNAAMVEQTSAASEQLRQQTEALMKSLARFRIPNRETGATRLIA